MTKKKRKKETSKILLTSTLVVCFLFLLAIVIAWIIWDKSEAAALAAIFAMPITAAIIWYYNKAKAENLLKIRKSLLEDPLINMEDKKHIVTESNKDFISYIDQRVVNLHNNTDTNNIE